MMPEADPARTTNRLLITIVVFLTGAVLKLAAPVVILLLLTVMLVYLIDPIVVLLNKARLPLWLSALIAIVFIGSVFASFAVLIIIDLPHFARTFPKFQEEILKRAAAMLDIVERNFGVSFAIDPFEELRTAPLRPILMGMARSSLRMLSEFTLIFFFAVILLLGKYRLIRMLLTVFPKRHSMVPLMLKHVDRHMRAFLGIKALASLAIGLGTALILLAFRVEFAVTWGFLTLLLNFVPVVGPITAVSLPTLITLVQFTGPVPYMAMAVVASLTALHLSISNFLEPRFLGERLDLSFFVIFLSLFFWGWMWGPAGVLLAIPVTASLKIVLERIPATSRFAMLLGRTSRRRNFNPPR